MLPDPKQFGEAIAEQVRGYVARAYDGLVARFSALEQESADIKKRIAEIPAGPPGERGEKGDPGQSVVGERGERGESGKDIDPALLEERVSEQMETLGKALIAKFTESGA